MNDEAHVLVVHQEVDGETGWTCPDCRGWKHHSIPAAPFSDHDGAATAHKKYIGDDPVTAPLPPDAETVVMNALALDSISPYYTARAVLSALRDAGLLADRGEVEVRKTFLGDVRTADVQRWVGPWTPIPTEGTVE